MTQVQIRQAVSGDIAALRDLQERSMRVLGRQSYSTTQIETYIARIGTMDDYLVSDRTYLVAELDGELLGCGGWTTRLPGYARHAVGEAHTPDPGRATIRSVFVEPIAARQGVGRRIMGAIEGFLRRNSFCDTELSATDNSRAFYGSLGYRPLSVFEVDIGDGISLRLTRMRKALVSATSDGPDPSSMPA